MEATVKHNISNKQEKILELESCSTLIPYIVLLLSVLFVVLIILDLSIISNIFYSLCLKYVYTGMKI